MANPGDAGASFTIALLERNQGNPSPRTKSFTIAAGKSVRYEDVLASMFGFSGAAALRITVDTGLIAVTSRTYNATTSGTYGQFIDGVLDGTAIESGQEGRIIQLSHKRSTSSGYRTNIGFVNATDASLALTIDLYRADGALLGTRTYNLAPYEYRQVDKIYEGVTGSEVGDGYAVLYTTTPGGRFFAYASVVDNRTGDPVYITPGVRRHGGGTPPAGSTAGSGEQGAMKAGLATGVIYVPASAHVSGASGTNWRTDLELHNPGAVQGRYEVALLKRNRGNASPLTKVFTVEPGRSARFEDVLFAKFGFSGAAALRITPLEGEAMVTSRTYNLTSNGTYGQFISGVSERTAVVAGEEALQIQLSHQPGGGSGFRTNVGMLNCTGDPLVIDARFFSASGTQYGTKAYSLEPYEFVQVDRIFESVVGGSVADGYLRLSTSTVDGRFLAYASIIDNRTGDPVFAPGIPVPETDLVPIPPATAAETAFTLLELLGEDDVPAFEEAARDIDERGMETVLDDLVSELPEYLSRIPNGVRIDFGDRLVLDDGSVVSGSVRLTYSNLNVSSGHHSYDFTIEEENAAWDGQYSDLHTVTGNVDVTLESSRMVGDASFSGSGTGPLGPGGGASITLTGSAHVDTSICPNLPVSGSVTLTRGSDTYTMTFTDDCDGSYDWESSGQKPDLSIRLSWDGPIDLDLYGLEPGQEEEISHENPVSPTGGRLDRNCNEDCKEEDPHPSETVSWPAGQSPRGEYAIWVETGSGCGGDRKGKPYTVEVLEGGVVKETWHETSGDFTNPHWYDY